MHEPKGPLSFNLFFLFRLTKNTTDFVANILGGERDREKRRGHPDFHGKQVKPARLSYCQDRARWGGGGGGQKYCESGNDPSAGSPTETLL